MTMIDIIIIGLICCVVTFGMGVAWRNQYNVQMSNKVAENFETLREKNVKLMSASDELMSANDMLRNTLDKASIRLTELEEERSGWAKACIEAEEELEMIDTLVFWDEELKKEYEENKKQYKKELEEIANGI